MHGLGMNLPLTPRFLLTHIRNPLLGLLLALGMGCQASHPVASSANAAANPGRPSVVRALPVTRAAGAVYGSANPFADAEMYRDPSYRAKVESSAMQEPGLASAFEQVKQQPTGLWLDRIAAVSQVPTWLGDAAAQSKALGKPVVPLLVVYDLPNRDCAAKSSSGELSIEAGGEVRYREEYIDVIAQHLAEAPDQRVVIILEPDSLPNLISNLGVDKCHAAQQVYLNSVAYAISKLSLPNVALYLDAAHAGWLGWEANRRRMAKLAKTVLDMAGGPDRIRGFATNVANYNALHGDWGTRLESSTPTPNETAYVQAFAESLAQEGITNKGFLIDTSRNGQAGTRTRWGNWCNIRGAGLGERPRAAPVAGIDAYVWVKPPGDSDGTADPNAVRFDENCASVDATAGAPEAGQWFHSYFVDLVRNANPPL